MASCWLAVLHVSCNMVWVSFMTCGTDTSHHVTCSGRMATALTYKTSSRLLYLGVSKLHYLYMSRNQNQFLAMFWCEVGNYITISVFCHVVVQVHTYNRPYVHFCSSKSCMWIEVLLFQL